MTGSQGVRLFCLPYAGGSAWTFRGWDRLLPAGVELVALEPPGRGARIREPLCHDVAGLVDDLGRTVLLSAAAPVALFGHSLGALVAYEIARRMTGLGVPPVHLIVSGHRAPHLPARGRPIHRLPPGEFWREVHRLGGVPDALLAERDMVDLLTPVLRADFEATETYRHRDGPPLGCPVTVLGGSADPEVPLTNLTGWRRHTTGPYRCRLLPGDHFFLHRETDRTLDAIRSALCPPEPHTTLRGRPDAAPPVPRHGGVPR